MFPSALFASDPLPPQINGITTSNRQHRMSWTPFPGADQYNVLSTSNLNQGFVLDPSGVRLGNTWTSTNSGAGRFYRVQTVPLSSNAVLSANILNRLTYGPTPDEVERIAQIGPAMYLDQQLMPEDVPNTYDSYVSVVTNGVSLPPDTNWTVVNVVGSVSSSTLYMYLGAAGEVSVDNIQYRYRYIHTDTTNTAGVITTTVYTNETGNLLTNGDFESAPTTGWTVSNNLTNSYRDPSVAYSGSSSLRLVATVPGTTQGSSIWQNVPAADSTATVRGTNALGQIYTNRTVLQGLLSFAYRPNEVSRYLTLRLSGSGVIISGQDEPGPPEWIYAKFTGTATSSRYLYVYLSGAGEGWIDDVKLVSGTVAEAGSNLLQNGGFESPFAPAWTAVGNHAGSVIDNTVSRTGNGSLRLVATDAGSGNQLAGNSVVQTNIAVVNNGTYTISFWYRPATRSRTTVVRISGQPSDQSPDRLVSGLKRRLDNAEWSVSLDELRTWFCHNAVGSPHQLLEILTQFFENHFVTYHSKTVDYLDRFYDDFNLMGRIAADLEYREVSRWRNALLNPNCTFYDLLKISAESPAQIIYLDTVGSRGDAARIANENYARELFELYCMGVDNGYDQNDIVHMSRAWTGWTVDLVRKEHENNPFAPRAVDTLQYGYYGGAGYNAVSNRIGVWTFVFDPNWHGTNRAPILSEWNPNSPATNPVAMGPKIVPARFGPPWAGQPYQLVIPRRTGTNGIQDGYDVLRHLANLPFTAEYLSVKLCRLFVHDGFPNPTTREGLFEYDFYDYTNPNRSAEAELVRRCIVAWDTPGPDGRKGNLRSVLRTIFDSELFRSQASARQKVKTPLEFVISAARALRSVDASGNATAFTDGNFNSPLSRMGQMSLFNRADPDGYPEAGAPWISAGTLAERLRFVQTLCMNTGQTGGRPSDAGNNTVNPVALIQRKLPGSQSNPVAVADYFVNLMFPGEGRANLELYRQAAINFLNDGSADSTVADRTKTFAQLTVSGSANSSYDTRVRGMVSMLMTLQRFQEQ